MSCGEHLAWGYVDQPPLAPFMAFLERALLGDSLRAIRFIPALASSLLVVQAAWLAREFGGRGFAMLLAADLRRASPAVSFERRACSAPTVCEPTLWLACAHCAVLAIKREEPRWWLAFGVVAGIGLENKYTIAIFGAGVVLGLLATAQRRAFASRWIWLGGLAALLIFLPNLLWNWFNDWPFVELMRAVRAEGRDVVLPAGD